MHKYASVYMGFHVYMCMKVRSQGTVPPDTHTHTHFETGSLTGLNSVVQGTSGIHLSASLPPQLQVCGPTPALHMGFWVSDSRSLAYKEIISPT